MFGSPAFSSARCSLVALCALLLGLAGCARDASQTTGAGSREGDGAAAGGRTPSLRRVRVQLDWFPQAEHGGFYQALARGFYREAGLAVELLPGGPGAHIKPKIVARDVEFGLNPATDVIVAAGRGLPLYMVGAFLQHDHETLLLHEQNPVRTFAQLDGRTLIVHPSLAWVQYLKTKYKIGFSIQPVPYGLARFLSDPEAIQAGVVTNEPWLALQAGKRVRLLPLSEAGYDTYHVIVCHRELARAEPALMRAFVRASLRGWEDYLGSDPGPAHSLILERNTSMSEAFLRFSRGELILRRLVHGDPARGEYLGRFSMQRVGETIRMLRDLKLLDKPLLPEAVATPDFSP